MVLKAYYKLVDKGNGCFYNKTVNNGQRSVSVQALIQCAVPVCVALWSFRMVRWFPKTGDENATGPSVNRGVCFFYSPFL